ncbi:hypothetical protein U1872_05930 [Sphingomonas sp. RB3P16]|uniref:hypothetical protein n=1 Tax=Parasphingomonas frigoris TaxID=3096163 RepID=UPI002FCB3D85
MTIVTTQPEPIQTAAAPVSGAAVQSQTSAVVVAPAPADVPRQEPVELPVDLKAIESAGATEAPLGDGGAALGQP